MPELIQIKCDRCGTVSPVGSTGNPALCKVQVDDTSGAQTDSQTFVLGPECFAARQQTMLLMFPFSDVAQAAVAQAQAVVTAGPAGSPGVLAASAFIAAIGAAQAAQAAAAPTGS